MVRRTLSFIIDLYLIFCVSACQRIISNGIDDTNSTLIPDPKAIMTLNTFPNVTTNTIEPVIPTDDKFIPLIISVTQTDAPSQTVTPLIMCSPLKSETIPSLWEIITNPFGSPPIGREDLHHGVDFAYYRRGDRLTIKKEIIQSILTGTVAASIKDRLPYGNMVIIETDQSRIPEEIIKKIEIKPGDSLYSLYAHMDQPPQVDLGDKVNCGQEVGAVGETGYDIGDPHLHLETRIGLSGVVFTGMAFYDTSASFDEMENYKRWRTSGDFTNIDPMLVFAEYMSLIDSGFQTPVP